MMILIGLMSLKRHVKRGLAHSLLRVKIMTRCESLLMKHDVHHLILLLSQKRRIHSSLKFGMVL